MKGTNRLTGVQSDYPKDFFIGVAIAVGFYLISKVLGILAVIGIPTLPESISGVGDFLIIVIAASVFETVFFFDFVLDFFDSKLFDAPFIVAAILSSIAFATWHFLAYKTQICTQLAMQNCNLFTPLLIVFIWGMIFAYLRYYTNSIVAPASAHGTINFILEFIINRRIFVFG